MKKSVFLKNARKELKEIKKIQRKYPYGWRSIQSSMASAVHVGMENLKENIKLRKMFNAVFLVTEEKEDSDGK